MKINKEEFGVLPDGNKVYKYTLENSKGFRVGIINYGSIITEIFSPDRSGKFENIVLGYDKLEAYLENPAYLGAVVGRVAGRISKGSFLLNGNRYELDKNNEENNLHGGIEGLSKKLWNTEKTEAALILSYKSRHMESGFPGNVEFEVRYSVTEENSLDIEYRAKPDRETIINLTNHSYFNLSGDMKAGGEKQVLKINSDFICEIDEEILPTGQKIYVKDTNFDFRNGKSIEEGLLNTESDYNMKIAKGYDHPFILNSMSPQITLFSLESGRNMEIETDQKVVVFYSGNYLHGTPVLNGNKKAEDNLGICLETQDYPDAVNTEEFHLEIYSPEKPYRSKNSWKFSIKQEG
jgi:aldose 1-epimerase